MLSRSLLDLVEVSLVCYVKFDDVMTPICGAVNLYYDRILTTHAKFSQNMCTKNHSFVKLAPSPQSSFQCQCARNGHVLDDVIRHVAASQFRSHKRCVVIPVAFNQKNKTEVNMKSFQENAKMSLTVAEISGKFDDVIA